VVSMTRVWFATLTSMDDNTTDTTTGITEVVAACEWLDEARPRVVYEFASDPTGGGAVPPAGPRAVCARALTYWVPIRRWVR